MSEEAAHNGAVKEKTKENKEDKGAENGSETSKRQSLIKELRKELETYFAPQNLRQDAYLQQNMTKDGYIDIKLLMSIKLIDDLVQDDDQILIEAIRESKYLKMNSQETMVKYSELIERKTLIIRNLPSNTPKKDVLKIFDNSNCSKPKDIRSDIADHWFIEFNSEDECSSTALWLQSNGKYKGKKLNVRIKSVPPPNTKNDAIYKQQPIMLDNQVPVTSVNVPVIPTQIYTPTVPVTAYYATPIIDPTIVQQQRQQRRAPAGDYKYDEDNKETKDKKKYHIPQNESDYPGTFLKYDREKFLKIYKDMLKNDDLKIPDTMRGRDNRIVSEKVLIPVSIPKKQKNEETKFDNDNKKKKNKQIKYYDNNQRQYYRKKNYNNNNQRYYDNYRQNIRKYYKPKGQKIEQEKKKKTYDDDIIYQPTGRGYYVKGWKPKQAVGAK